MIQRIYVKTGLTLDSFGVSLASSSTSCALFWVKWCWLGMWGIGVRPYDLAKQLNPNMNLSLTLVTRYLPDMFSGPRSGCVPTKDGGEDDTMNDDEFSQYALSTMRSIMGDTDITQWEWLIEFRDSVPYTSLHLGFDMRKHIPSPSSSATNSSTALCGELLQCRIPHIEGEIWLCDRCITH